MKERNKQDANKFEVYMQHQARHKLLEVVINTVQNFSLSQKRFVYAIIRDERLAAPAVGDVFIPSLGITLGEFAINYVLASNSKR